MCGTMRHYHKSIRLQSWWTNKSVDNFKIREYTDYCGKTLLVLKHY